MNKTAIIVDSTAYLSEELSRKENIFQIDLVAHFSDGTEIIDSNDPEIIDKFFKRIDKESNLPKTSQPPIGIYYNLVEEIINLGYNSIIAIHLSAGISGTYQTAKTVLEEYKNLIQAYCVDSRGASVIIEHQVEFVLKSLEVNMPLEEIHEKLLWLVDNTSIYLMVENLNNLAKGGRLTSTGALLGNLLKIRPLLFFNEEGKIVMFEKLRTNKKVYQRWLELIQEALEKYPQGIEIRLAHTSIEEEMDQIQAMIQDQYPETPICRNRLGAVIATHTGPGSKGIGIIPKI